MRYFISSINDSYHAKTELNHCRYPYHTTENMSGILVACFGSVDLVYIILIPRFITYLIFGTSIDLLPEQTIMQLCAFIQQCYRSVILLIAINMEFIWEFVVDKQSHMVNMLMPLQQVLSCWSLTFPY